MNVNFSYDDAKAHLMDAITHHNIIQKQIKNDPKLKFSKRATQIIHAAACIKNSPTFADSFKSTFEQYQSAAIELAETKTVNIPQETLNLLAIRETVKTVCRDQESPYLTTIRSAADHGNVLGAFQNVNLSMRAKNWFGQWTSFSDSIAMDFKNQRDTTRKLRKADLQYIL